MKKDKRVIVYVNFAPYVNAGKILDYINQNFSTVIVFSFNFYSLGKAQERSSLSFYKEGKLVKKNYLYQLSTNMPISLIFLLLPIRSAIILVQIFWHLLVNKKEYEAYDIYFTVNAFSAWIGNLLKRVNIIDKTIYWVWDYYPPIHENKIVMLFRWMYWQFDRSGAVSDKTVYLNHRLIELRKTIGAWGNKKNNQIIPIGTDPVKNRKKFSKIKLKLVFVGVLKKSQGLDLVFENSKAINQSFPKVLLNVVGSGPDENYYKKKAIKSGLTTVFHGFMPNEKNVEKIISSSDIGIATYIPEESNVSYFGDPSKIKLYLSRAVPVITTNVFTFSEEIKISKAGIIIKYSNPKEFIRALKKIKKSESKYSANALKLAKKYYYKRIYKEIFIV